MEHLRTADFDYELPPELIAQTPIEPRDQARLLIARRGSGVPSAGPGQVLEHRRFHELPGLLRPGDLLVMNESRVIPARLLGRKEGEGGAAIEVLLLREREPGLWEALVRRARRLKVGDRIVFGPASSPALGEGWVEGETLTATLEDVLPSGARLLRLSDAVTWERLGQVPLPPYIHAPLADLERYQTVYARPKGSVAAPTAGLHFTPVLLERLRARGVELAFLTLHIGWDTFRPVTEADPSRHKLMREWCSIPAATVGRLRAARREGRRIVAVGTTACRALEWAADHILTTSSPSIGEGRSEGAPVRPAPVEGPHSSGLANPQLASGSGPIEGWADLLILPGHRFRLVDALITNFHLPRSTLLMLVSAFAGQALGPAAGRDLVLNAYAEAVRQRYRFYSFGDAMLVL